MDETEGLRDARAVRRAVLGDAYVDRMTVDVEPAAAEFQDYLTTVARRVWARGDVLTRRDRSLLVMAMTAALGRMEEFRLHLEAVEQHGLPASIGAVTASVWQQFATVEPGADFTRIYPFVQGSA